MTTTPPYTPKGESHGLPRFADSTLSNNSTISNENESSFFDTTSLTNLTSNLTLLDDPDSFNSSYNKKFHAATSNPYNSPESPFCSQFSKDTKPILNALYEENIENDTPIIAKPLVKRKFTRLPLKPQFLNDYVLSSSIFDLTLQERIGQGSNSYVYRSTLSTKDNYTSLNVAVKIPSSRNKVKFIERETKFSLVLKTYQNEVWCTNNNDQNTDRFPFLDSYGLFYLNKDKFPMMKKTDELPCLVIKRMDMDLANFIQQISQTQTKLTDLAIGYDNWWCLCKSLLDALSILQNLKSVHCDLKTENILVSEPKDGSQPIFKVIDFSSSSKIEDLTELPDMTLQFTAPELISADNIILPNYKTDLFSVGMVLLHAATGKLPYQECSYDQYYLIRLVKEMQCLNVLSREDLQKLNSNPKVFDLIKLILIDRCELSEAINYYSRATRAASNEDMETET